MLAKDFREAAAEGFSTLWPVMPRLHSINKPKKLFVSFNVDFSGTIPWLDARAL